MARTVNPQHTQALMDLLTQAPYFSSSECVLRPWSQATA